MATKTTGGGLLGRADSSLVQGALKTELANIAPDMRDIYKLQEENVTNLQTAVQDIFYAFDKSNNDLKNEVKELTPKLLADIETGTYIDDSYVDLVSQEINSLRQQMKSIPKGREGEAERAKIRARLANLKAESGSAEQTMTKIATLIDNDQIDLNSLQTGDMELWKSILNKTAKREFIDGKLMYTTKTADGEELKISHSDLEKRFIPKQYGVQTNALKLSGGYTKIGRSGVAFDFDEAVNSYEGLMTDKAGFLHLINNPFSTMKYSFKDALKGKDPKLVGELMGALNNVGGFDIDGDGELDTITKSNLSTLVDVLTDPDNKNFNLATSKRVAAAFYADNDGRAQHQKGKALYDLAQKQRTENNDEDNVFTKDVRLGPLMGSGANQYRSKFSPLEAQGIVNKIENGEDLTFFSKLYKFENNEWVEYDQNPQSETYGQATGSKFPNADSLVKSVIQSNHPGFSNLKTQPKANPESGLTSQQIFDNNFPIILEMKTSRDIKSHLEEKVLKQFPGKNVNIKTLNNGNLIIGDKEFNYRNFAGNKEEIKKLLNHFISLASKPKAGQQT